MTTPIAARELRNNYGRIIERVRGGEQLTVVSDGVAVMDLVPHLSDATPPRFRPAADRRGWVPLDTEASHNWAQDIGSLDDVVDQTPRDPWADA